MLYNNKTMYSKLKRKERKLNLKSSEFGRR